MSIVCCAPDNRKPYITILRTYSALRVLTRTLPTSSKRPVEEPKKKSTRTGHSTTIQQVHAVIEARHLGRLSVSQSLCHLGCCEGYAGTNGCILTRLQGYYLVSMWTVEQMFLRTSWAGVGYLYPGLGCLETVQVPMRIEKAKLLYAEKGKRAVEGLINWQNFSRSHVSIRFLFEFYHCEAALLEQKDAFPYFVV